MRSNPTLTNQIYHYHLKVKNNYLLLESIDNLHLLPQFDAETKDVSKIYNIDEIFSPYHYEHIDGDKLLQAKTVYLRNEILPYK